MSFSVFKTVLGSGMFVAGSFCTLVGYSIMTDKSKGKDVFTSKGAVEMGGELAAGCIGMLICGLGSTLVLAGGLLAGPEIYSMIQRKYT